MFGSNVFYSTKYKTIFYHKAAIAPATKAPNSPDTRTVAASPLSPPLADGLDPVPELVGDPEGEGVAELAVWFEHSFTMLSGTLNELDSVTSAHYQPKKRQFSFKYTCAGNTNLVKDIVSAVKRNLERDVRSILHPLQAEGTDRDLDAW